MTDAFVRGGKGSDTQRDTGRGPSDEEGRDGSDVDIGQRNVKDSRQPPQTRREAENRLFLSVPRSSRHLDFRLLAS